MNQTILLIEDNAQNRYLVTFLLEQHGFTVLSANTGPSGIAMAQAQCPTSFCWTFNCRAWMAMP